MARAERDTFFSSAAFSFRFCSARCSFLFSSHSCNQNAECQSCSRCIRSPRRHRSRHPHATRRYSTTHVACAGMQAMEGSGLGIVSPTDNPSAWLLTSLFLLCSSIAASVFSLPTYPRVSREKREKQPVLCLHTVKPQFKPFPFFIERESERERARERERQVQREKRDSERGDRERERETQGDEPDFRVLLLPCLRLLLLLLLLPLHTRHATSAPHSA